MRIWPTPLALLRLDNVDFRGAASAVATLALEPGAWVVLALARARREPLTGQPRELAVEVGAAVRVGQGPERGDGLGVL